MQYCIQNDVIKEVRHAKYLGVIIDHHLSWNEHIIYITSKTNNVKCFLQYNLSQCPTHIKSNCYQSLVHPILEYPCIVWAPHSQKNISTNEALQRRATMCVTNNYSSYASVSDMLTHLQWTSLNNWRESEKISMLHKIIQQLIDIPKSNIIPVLGYYCMHLKPRDQIYSYSHMQELMCITTPFSPQK